MKPEEAMKSLNAYFELMTHFGAAIVFQTAKGFGITEAFKQGELTEAEVAQKCQIQAWPCKLMLDCLSSMGLLSQQGNRYAPTPLFGFLGGQYQNLGKEYWDHLPAFLKTGTPIARMDDVRESEKEYEKQALSLEWMLKPSAYYAAAFLIQSFSKPAPSILDIGAGSGVWSIQWLKQNIHAKATLADWPGVLKIAEKSAEDLGVRGRCQFLPGNFHETRFQEQAFDVALLGNVTHIQTPEGLRKLLKKTHSALKSGGEAVIFDVFPAQEQGKLSASLYSLGLALRTQQGRVYTFDELKTALVETGFESKDLMPIPCPPFTMGMIRALRK